MNNYLILILLACLSFVMGAPKIDVDIIDEGEARFTTQFLYPSIPIERNRKPPTELEETANLSWLKLTPDGKLKKYLIKSLPVWPSAPGHSLDIYGKLMKLDNEPTIGDNGTEEVQKRFIFSPDDRVQTNTAYFPRSVVGLLKLNGGYCTATLIGPKHILTAGHCVHQGGGGNWYSGFKFYPGLNSFPDSEISFGWSSATTVTAWTEDGNFYYDYAVIELDSNTGRGWMSFGWNNNIAPGWIMNINGYPGDKPYGTQWHTHGPLAVVGTNNFLDHSLDLYDGNSGSGLYAYWSSKNQRIIYGVFSAHATEQYWDTKCSCMKNRYWNHHVRITGVRFHQICDWIDNPNVC